MSIEEENKEIIRRWIEGLNEQTINDELLSKDYVYHVGGQEVKGAQTFKQSADATFFPVFPDVNYATDDMVAEGDKVAIRYIMTATHKGEFMGIAPTGKRITLTGAIFYHLADGKIMEALQYFDQLSMMQQLGAIPSQ